MVPSALRAASASVWGIAGCCPLARSGTAFSNLPPMSGFWVALRYRVHQLVSTVSSLRLVSGPVCGTPVTPLGGESQTGLDRRVGRLLIADSCSEIGDG